MIRFPLSFAAFLLSIFVINAMVPPAHGEDAKSLGKFGDWESFSYTDRGAKVCYAATVLKSSEKAPKKRGLAIITLTNRPADKSIGVISIEPGLTLKKSVAPGLNVGTAKFELYVQGRSAWARDDKAVVAAMLKARLALFHGVPETGTPFVDTYSLAGFDKARTAIDTACVVR